MDKVNSVVSSFSVAGLCLCLVRFVCHVTAAIVFVFDISCVRKRVSLATMHTPMHKRVKDTKTERRLLDEEEHLGWEYCKKGSECLLHTSWLKQLCLCWLHICICICGLSCCFLAVAWLKAVTRTVKLFIASSLTSQDVCRRSSTGFKFECET